MQTEKNHKKNLRVLRKEKEKIYDSGWHCINFLSFYLSTLAEILDIDLKIRCWIVKLFGRQYNKLKQHKQLLPKLKTTEKYNKDTDGNLGPEEQE